MFVTDNLSSAAGKPGWGGSRVLQPFLPPAEVGDECDYPCDNYHNPGVFPDRGKSPSDHTEIGGYGGFRE